MFKKSDAEFYCDAQYKFMMSQIDGVVVEKFIDKNQHDYRTIVYESDSGIKRMVADFYIDLYHKMEVGDTIDKPKGSLRVKIDSDRYYTVDFGVDCN